MTTQRGAQPDASEDLVDGLVRSAFVTMAALSRVAAEHDLSLTQLRVLGILRDRRLRMAALADFLGLERSTMSGLVDRAVRRGLLERAVDRGGLDGRAVHVTVTEAGSALAALVRERVAEDLAPLVSALGVEDRGQLQALLERMLATASPS